MFRPLFILCLVVLFGATAQAAWVSHDSWRYRMTVTVETPEGLKSGFAVREIVRHTGLTLPEAGPHYTLDGEAVVVDLGRRGKLFATLMGIRGGDFDHGRWVVFQAFPGKDGPPKTSEKVALQLAQYPMFAAFKDLKDPGTAQQVLEVVNEGHYHYAVKADHTKEIFGSGVKIKDVTVEMTEAPVTQQIGTLLPWLPGYYTKMLDGEVYQTIKAENRFANSLASYAFKTK